MDRCGRLQVNSGGLGRDPPDVSIDERIGAKLRTRAGEVAV
jgi:hypothetical protein